MRTEEAVKIANARIARFLQMAAEQDFGPVRVTAEHLSGLLSDIQQMNEALHQYSRGTKSVRVDHEITEYRNNLDRLNTAMPRLKARLLTERACLERERNHLKAAAGWAQTSHKTL